MCVCERETEREQNRCHKTQPQPNQKGVIGQYGGVGGGELAFVGGREGGEERERERDQYYKTLHQPHQKFVIGMCTCMCMCVRKRER